MESDSIFGANTQSKISAAEDAFPGEMAITQASETETYLCGCRAAALQIVVSSLWRDFEK